MPKVLYDLYADFETTTIKLPKNFKSYKDYYSKVSNPKFPEIYSWNCMFTLDYKISSVLNLKQLNLLIENKEIKQFVSTEKNVISFYGICGESFIKFVKTIDSDCKIWFNNLKKFDGHFTIPLLDKMGYTNIFKYDLLKEIENPNTQKELFEIFEYRVKKLVASGIPIGEVYEGWNKLLKDEYSLMTNKNNEIYKLTISTDNSYWSNKRKKYRVVALQDNLLLFPASIKKMGETLIKQHITKFNWDEEKAKEWFEKKEISSNYKKYEKYNSFEEFENDGNEFNYLFNDVFILLKFQEMMREVYNRNNWKLTSASTAYAEWERIFGNSLIDTYTKQGLCKKIQVKNGGYKLLFRNKLYSPRQFGAILIKFLLPTKWMDMESEEGFPTIHSELYEWYNGGISQVNEKYRGQVISNISVLDINSSYPASMNCEALIPYGKGVRGNKKGYDFKLYTLYISDTIINKKGMPFVFNMNDKKRVYRSVLKEGMVIKLNTFEYERFLKYYNPKKDSYTLKVNWSFKTIKINSIFGEYVSYWFKIKEEASKNGDEALKVIAKLMLNALYGKFGSKSDRESKIWNQLENRWESYSELLDSKFYLPLAMSITALSRMRLVDGVGFNYDKVVYMDTDSLFIINFNINDFPNLKLDPYILGYWDIEKSDLIGVARRSKQYYYENMFDHNKKKLAFAGINFKREVIFDDEELNEVIKIEKNLTMLDFVKGKTIPAQLQPFRIAGEGLILIDIDKKIKPVWEYDRLPEQTNYKFQHFIKSIEICKKIIQNNIYYDNINYSDDKRLSLAKKEK